MPTDWSARTYVSRAHDDFEPAVVWQAVIATYVGCVVALMLLAGKFAIFPAWFFALFTVPYALPASIPTLTILYLQLRRRRVTGWVRGLTCLLGGATAGTLWGALAVRAFGYDLLVHAVGG